MSDTVILQAIVADARSLAQSIKGARADATLSNAEAERMLSGISAVFQVAKTISEHGTQLRPLWDRALPEWMRWPNRSMPCPKCDRDERGKAYYHPESAMGPERMQHTCACGYSIYTKSSDTSSKELDY